MRALDRLSALLRGWFRPEALDSEVAEELRFHLERQTQANIDAGMTPEAARRVARLVIGNPQAIRDESRDARPGALLRQLLHDLAYGMRLARRAPGLAIISTMLVALGVATTTAIFSVVYGVMLRPLPYSQPERLVALWTKHPGSALRARVNPADQRDWRSSNTVFDDIALANAPQNFNLIGSGEPERLLAARLSSNLLSVLGVTPAIGRGFTHEEDTIGNDRVILLSDGLWRRRFGADPSIVGRTINLSGTPFEVVGVMRPDFRFPEREYQLWIPLTINPRLLSREIAAYDHLAVARLTRGVSIEDAQRELEVIAARLEADYPATNRGVRVEVLPLPEESVRPVRTTLYVLLVAVFCLLVIACLTLASLLGTRAASRAREFTVRLALGASRGRLALQALAETAPMLAIGGIAGIVIARGAIDAFVPIAPAALPRVDRIEINGAVLVFSTVVLMLTGVVAGIMPAMQSWRAHITTATKAGRSATATRDHVRTRSGLVIAQLALTLPLLVGSTALVRSFSALMDVDPGFRTDNVLSLQMAIPRSKYRNDEQIAAFYGRVIERVAAVPGVRSAGMVNRLPLSGNNLMMAIDFDGVSGTRSPQSRSVTPDYFRTMSIAVKEGRVFSEEDTASAPLVGVIDERLARTLWPGESAVGKRYRVSLPGQQPASGQIVGVVGNVRHSGLDTEEDRQFYFSYHQFTDGRIVLVVRSRDDVRALTAAIIHEIRALDPDQPVHDVRTLDEVVARSAEQRWLNMAIVTAFGVSSLLLASVGLYGLIAYGVTQRGREFGLRLALGARPSEILQLVLRKGSTLAACGVALGLGGAIALTRTMESLLYGIEPFDPVGFAMSVTVLLVVALVASYLPARRAALTDPAVALRTE